MLLLISLQLTNINSRYIQWRIFRTVHYSKDLSLFAIQRVSVPSPQRAPLYRTDCEFLHPRGSHSIDRTVATWNGLRVSPQREPLYLHEFLHPRGSHSIDRTVATSNGLRVSPQREPLYRPYGGDIERTASFTAEGATLSTVRWRHRTDCEFLHPRGSHSIYRTVATSNGLRVPSPQREPLYLPYGGDIERTASSFTLEGTTLSTVRWRHRTDCEFLHRRGHHSIYAGPYPFVKHISKYSL